MSSLDNKQISDKIEIEARLTNRQMGNFSHFVITTISIEEKEDDQGQKIGEPKAFTQVLSFFMKRPAASWETKKTEQIEKDWIVLGEGTFFIKKKGRCPNGEHYEISEDDLKDFKTEDGKEFTRRELDPSVFKPVTKLGRTETGFRFNGGYDVAPAFREHKTLVLSYHLVLPEYFYLNENSIKRSNVTTYDVNSRTTRDTVTWRTNRSDIISIKAEADFLYSEKDWKHIRGRKPITSPIPDWARRLYGEGKFWAPTLSKFAQGSN